MSSKLIAFSNQKGGVGKSTFVVLIASYLHYVENLNVAVLDCDSMQYSLSRMRERDKQTISRSDVYKQRILQQWEKIRKKAYPIVNSTVGMAREAADRLLAEGQYDIILVDLPGTMEMGVLSTIINMDYVVTPIVADRMVMQSSLSFSTTVLDYIRDKEVPLKEIFFFWNRVNRRTSSEVFDIYNHILKQLNLTVLKTVIPETCRYEKELSLAGKSYFRSTLLPAPPKLLKDSGLIELINEVREKIGF